MLLSLIFVIVAGAGLLYFFAWYGKAKPSDVKQKIMWGGIAVGLMLVLFLALTGRLGLALAGLAGLAGWAMRAFSLMQTYQQMKKMFSGDKQDQPPGAAPGGTPVMTEEEALRILGLTKGAGPDDIKAAYRKLMAQVHPDKGGTDYLAAKINAAKDFLMRS